MQKRVKYLVALTLAVSMFAGWSAVLGKTGAVKGGFRAPKPVEFTMLFNDNASYPYSKDWLLWKAIKERTNVSLKLTVVPKSDWEQKRSLLIASGDAPDIIPKTYAGEVVQFIPSGAILPASDYVKFMPNFSKRVRNWKLTSELNTIRQKDGKYYLFPGLQQSFLQDYSYAVRTDIFKKHNIAIPKNYDQLYTALKSLKKAYPDVIPWSDRWQFKNTMSIGGAAFGIKCGQWAAYDVADFDRKKDQFIFWPATPQYKQFIAYFNKLVKEGLLDPQSLTQSDDQAEQKFVNGKSFMIGTNSQFINTYRMRMDSLLGKNKYEIAKIPVLAGPAGAMLRGSRLEVGVMLPAKAAKSPNFKQLLGFVDWMWYSDAGNELAQWGVEGTTFKRVGGKRELLPNITFSMMGLNPGGTTDLRKQCGFSCGNFMYGGPDELRLSMLNEDDRAFQVETRRTHKLRPLDPPVYLNEQQQEQFEMINKPLLDFVNQMTFKAILGQISLDKDWDKFLKECKAKGSDQLLNLYNKVYKESKKKK